MSSKACQPSGQFTLLSWQHLRTVQAPPSGFQLGRCKGRGIRIGARHNVRGKIYPLTDQVASGGTVSIPPCSIVILSSFRAEFAGQLSNAAGLILDEGEGIFRGAEFALALGIPAVLNIPNAGQFVDGETVCLLGDGRVMAAI